MGSHVVQALVEGQKNIHVGYDKDERMWWACGARGSYGGSRSVIETIHIAQDAAVSTDGVVVIHDKQGNELGRRSAASRASSQFFQDDVE